MLSPVFTEYQGKRFIFFSSPHSDNGCLSNWYESPFSLDSHDFKSAEQAFLYLKAMSSGDEATALRVFAMDEPRYFARLNKQIRPFDARRWAEEREAAMRRIVHEKFAQSEELTEFLLATGDATIVNCSRNPLWSCGLQMSQTERLDQKTWMGQNLLGTMLVELREELRPAEPEPAPEPEPAAEPEPAPLEKGEATPAPDEGESAHEEGAAPVGDGPSASDETAAASSTPAKGTDGTPSPQPTPDQTATPSAAPAAGEGDATATAGAASEDEPVAAPAAEQPAPEAVAAQQETPAAAPAAPAAPAGDAEMTELIPNAESFDKTTVIPSLDQTRLATGGTPAPQTAGTSATTSDALIARYERGDYPTADELADGSLLKHLIVSFTQDNSPAVRQALMQCLRDSVVAVPATKVEPLVASTAPVRDDGLSDPLIMDGGNTYRPSVLENDGGQRWFPAFSSVAEISDELTSRASVIMLPMAQCVELARTHGGLAGIVVNVFSENLILPGRTCDYIAGLPSHVA